MKRAITVRAAVEDDVAIVLDFIRELAEFEHLSHEVMATTEALRVALFGPRPYAEVLLAIVDGEAVGFALFFHTFSTFLARPGLYLEDLYVRPASRGHGVGSYLLSALARIALERDCGRFEWTVLDWNEAALGFYRKLGAEVKAEWKICRLAGTALTRLAARG